MVVAYSNIEGHSSDLDPDFHPVHFTAGVSRHVHGSGSRNDGRLVLVFLAILDEQSSVGCRYNFEAKP